MKPKATPPSIGQKPRKLSPRTIRARIRRDHPSIVAFARSLGVARGVVEGVLMGTKTSRRVANAIAACVGLPASEIWPHVPSYRQ